MPGESPAGRIILDAMSTIDSFRKALNDERAMRHDAEKRLSEAHKKIMDLHSEVVRLTAWLQDLKGKARDERSIARRFGDRG